MPRTAWPAAPSPRPGELDRCLAAQLARRYADLRAFATWFPAQGVEVPACWQAHGGVVHRLAAVYAWRAPAHAPDAHRREAADLWALGLARLQRDRESLLAHRGKHPPPDARGDYPCRSLSSRSSSRPRWPPVPSGTPSPAPPDGPHPPLPIPPALRARSPLTPGPRRHLGRLGCDLHHRQRGPSGPHALHRHLGHRWPRRPVAGHALRPAPAATPAPLQACDRGSPGVADPAGLGWPGVALRPTSGGGSGPGTAPLRRDQGVVIPTSPPGPGWCWSPPPVATCWAPPPNGGAARGFPGSSIPCLSAPTGCSGARCAAAGTGTPAAAERRHSRSTLAGGSRTPSTGVRATELVAVALHAAACGERDMSTMCSWVHAPARDRSRRSPRPRPPRPGPQGRGAAGQLPPGGP